MIMVAILGVIFDRISDEIDKVRTSRLWRVDTCGDESILDLEI